LGVDRNIRRRETGVYLRSGGGGLRNAQSMTAGKQRGRGTGPKKSRMEQEKCSFSRRLRKMRCRKSRQVDHKKKINRGGVGNGKDYLRAKNHPGRKGEERKVEGDSRATCHDGIETEGNKIGERQNVQKREKGKTSLTYRSKTRRQKRKRKTALINRKNDRSSGLHCRWNPVGTLAKTSTGKPFG